MSDPRRSLYAPGAVCVSKVTSNTVLFEPATARTPVTRTAPFGPINDTMSLDVKVPGSMASLKVTRTAETGLLPDAFAVAATTRGPVVSATEVPAAPTARAAFTRPPDAILPDRTGNLSTVEVTWLISRA